MAYTALYRKFRPDTFEEVKGQEAIVTTLKNQIRSGRIGHAYLFCGTRGTGKTTLAKILGRAVNCENPVDGNPCNECKMCRAIATGASMNVVEIDAASNNGVDNIREIVEEVRYSPTEGRYRVYIVDEVHMLSTGAFNALLKTLEEPPEYVVFILATTEAHKIPITILSRCQRYDFKRIRLDTIASRLAELCKREGIAADEKATAYIAKAADGSMRDALSLLERCVAFYYQQELTYDKVLELLGSVDIEMFARATRYIHDGEVLRCMGLLEELVSSGRDLSRFIVDWTWYMRNLLLAKSGGDISEVLEIPSEQMQVLLHEARLFSSEELMRYIGVCCELTNQLRFATQKRILIEMTLVRLCKPQTEANADAVLERVRQLEDALDDLRRTGVAIPSNTMEEAPAVEPVQELPKALPEDIARVAEDWKEIVRRFTQLGRLSLDSCRPSVTENGHLLLVFRHEVDYRLMNSEERKDQLQKLIGSLIGKQVPIEAKLLEAGEAMGSYADITVLNKRLKNITIEITE